MNKLFAIIQRIEAFLLAWSIITIAALSIGNVVCRALFGFSLAFVGEVSQFLIIIVTFIGLSYAASQGRHIRMTAPVHQGEDVDLALLDLLDDAHETFLLGEVVDRQLAGEALAEARQAVQQAPDVAEIRIDQDVDILGEADVALECHRQAAYDYEIDPRISEPDQQFFVRGFHDHGTVTISSGDTEHGHWPATWPRAARPEPC